MAARLHGRSGELSAAVSPAPAEAPADQSLAAGTVGVRQVLVLCAARWGVGETGDTAHAIANEVGRLAGALEAAEVALIVRDVRTDIRFDLVPTDVATAWQAAIRALEATPAPDGAVDVVNVSVPAIVFPAVRYALGRQTYMPSLVAEEVRRIAGRLARADRRDIAAAIEEHKAGSAANSEDGRDWAETVRALRAYRS